jgi:hypothetical protein
MNKSACTSKQIVSGCSTHHIRFFYVSEGANDNPSPLSKSFLFTIYKATVYRLRIV